MSEQSTGGPVPSLTFYAGETERLRSAAKWLTTALAGTAGALVAGLQLTDLGHLSVHHDLPRLSIAVVALAVALAGVGCMIRQTVPVFTSRWLDLGDLQRAEFLERYLQDAPLPTISRQAGQVLRRRGRPPDRAAYAIELLDSVNRLGPTLYHHVAPTIAELQQRVAAANTEAALSFEEADAGDRRVLALLTVEQTREAAQAVVVYANYLYIRRGFDSLVRRLIWLGGAVATAVSAFAYAVTPPR